MRLSWDSPFDFTNGISIASDLYQPGFPIYVSRKYSCLNDYDELYESTPGLSIVGNMCFCENSLSDSEKKGGNGRGGKYFGCQHCYNLSYESRNETRSGMFGTYGRK
jgi:hypothetical protein